MGRIIEYICDKLIAVRNYIKEKLTYGNKEIFSDIVGWYYGD